MKAQVASYYSVEPTPLPKQCWGEITRFDKGSGMWLIDNEFCAKVAVSLLVKPELGDCVAFVSLAGHGYIIQQILCRAEQHCEVTMQLDHDVRLIAPNIAIQAQDNLDLAALNKASLMSENLQQSAQKSFVQQADNMILQATQLSATADSVMNLSAQQHLLVAEEDVRIDGNRISMG